MEEEDNNINNNNNNNGILTVQFRLYYDTAILILQFKSQKTVTSLSKALC